MLILWALLCGFFTGGFVSLVSPVIVSISDNNLAEIGCVLLPSAASLTRDVLPVRPETVSLCRLRQGIAFVLIAGAAVGGNPVCGRLLANRNGDFLDSIMFAGSAVVLGALVALLGRMAFARQRGTWRV